MAFTSAFFDAELVNGEYDREYSAEHFAEYFASFIANGVFPDPATNLQVVANTVNDMNVLVSTGMGWINGYYCKNDGSYPLAIQAANGTLNRIDAVVIGWSQSDRTITAYVKTGVAASAPTAPSLERSADRYELMLATITVNAGVTKVTQSMITDKRPDSSVCGWVAGVVQQIDATNLFAQYDAAFQAWFEDIQEQLSGDVATNLQNQINQLKTDKVDVLDKATEIEALAGTSNSKWMTPALVKKVTDRYRNLAIGDVFHSANNVEVETSGKFIALDGRSIDVITGYPGLANIYELKYRLSNPLVLNTGNITYSMAYKQGVSVNGIYFWIQQYGPNGNYSLMRRDTAGNITSLANNISTLVVANGQIVAGTTSGAYAKVYNTAGTLLRNITLNSSSSYQVNWSYTDGKRVWFGTNYNNTCYGWYSDDNFATFGTTTWANYSSGYVQGGWSYNSQLFYPVQEYEGNLYLAAMNSSTYTMYKSTDKGASFSRLFQFTGSTTAGHPNNSNFFIYGGYIYMLGYINETVDSKTYSRAVMLKYSMSGSLLLKSSIISSSQLSSTFSGFIKDGYAYLTGEYKSFKVNLTNLDWEDFLPYPNFYGRDTKGVVIGDYYIIVNLTYAQCYPSYETTPSGRYNTIILYHIPSGKSVCLFNSSYMYSNSGTTCVGVPFEDDGNIIIPCGYSQDYKYSGLLKIPKNIRVLPSLDYAYIKTEEVS